ncbi:MAG TPA: hypothetical protein VKT83_18035 [bacterium]|nr:hypothetical protein [bacterium]
MERVIRTLCRLVVQGLPDEAARRTVFRALAKDVGLYLDTEQDLRRENRRVREAQIRRCEQIARGGRLRR